MRMTNEMVLTSRGADREVSSGREERGVSARRIEEMMFQRVDDELRRCFQTKFLEDARPGRADGRDAEVQEL